MNAATLNCIKAVLQADDTVTPEERSRLLGALKNGERPSVKEPPRIVRRREIASRMSCSLRLADKMLADGTLKKVFLPGRQRSCGALESDLLALINGKEAA